MSPPPPPPPEAFIVTSPVPDAGDMVTLEPATILVTPPVAGAVYSLPLESTPTSCVIALVFATGLTEPCADDVASGSLADAIVPEVILDASNGFTSSA